MMSQESMLPGIDSAIDYLMRALPEEDLISLSDAEIERVARHALLVREIMPWGRNIPDDIFMPFVLFPRINNEDPVFYHGPLWEALQGRLQGLEMLQAVQEVNKWCFEQATYRSTDARTANALTIIRRGFGRCGEESTLLTCALRACGIPARQVYVPFWSHCDDNHAWVEAWVDGCWHYMGACEPELTLDSGWFTAAASKAMLIHTRAYGMLPEGERAETHIGNVWLINRLAAYAQTRLLRVYVKEGKTPRAGIHVHFEVANMGDFRHICKKVTDAEGKTDLLTGLGTLHLWISDGKRAVGRMVDVEATDTIEIDFEQACRFSPCESAFRQRSPKESRIQPHSLSPDAVLAHEKWMQQVTTKREGCFWHPEITDELLLKARGNIAVIQAFISSGKYEPADVRALLESLREKDLADVTGETLDDAMVTALLYKAGYPRSVWIESILCPRVQNEMLAPVRAWMRDSLPDMKDENVVWTWLGKLHTIEECDRPIIPNLKAALLSGRCTPPVRDILFVAICRAKGIAARLNPYTGEKEVWREGEYQPLLGDDKNTAAIILKNQMGQALIGGTHFSVSRMESGFYHPMSIFGETLSDQMAIHAAPGDYRVMTVNRQIDGSIEGWTKTFTLSPGEKKEIGMHLQKDDIASMLIRAELPLLTVKRHGQPEVYPTDLMGKRAIIAVVHPGQEPTMHLLDELKAAGRLLCERDIAVRFILEDKTQIDHPELTATIDTLQDAHCAVLDDSDILIRWRELLDARELRLPLAVAVDKTGRGLFAFVNYRVGSVAMLINILDQ